jgi:hypothetical protein
MNTTTEITIAVESLIASLSTPNPTLFSSADEQFFDAFAGVTAYRNAEFVEAIEDQFIHHPNYDLTIINLCNSFNRSPQTFCEINDLPRVIS